jgi:hypothetical protein
LVPLLSLTVIDAPGCPELVPIRVVLLAGDECD